MLNRTVGILSIASIASLAAAPALAQETQRPMTVVEVSSAVPLRHDGCLDHSVKELGMSAKRPDAAARRWDIVPKYLHVAIAGADADAALTVIVTRGDKDSRVQVRATWAGAPKERAVQLEIEERLRSMTTKMAQMCGVTKPALSCTTTPAGGAGAPCPVKPL